MAPFPPALFFLLCLLPLSLHPLNALSLVASPLGFSTPFVEDDHPVDSNGVFLPLSASSSPHKKRDQPEPPLSSLVMSRSTRGSFPYSTIASYRSLRPLLDRYKMALQQEAQYGREGHALSKKELAEMVDMLEGRTKKRTSSRHGRTMKRYACRFKFCHVFSPNDE